MKIINTQGLKSWYNGGQKLHQKFLKFIIGFTPSTVLTQIPSDI